LAFSPLFNLLFFMPARTDCDKTAKELFLNHAEAFCLKQGRELVRQSLENLLQEQIKTREKKETRHCSTCNKKKRHRGYRRKIISSSIGTITLTRRYDECLPCRLPEHAVDEPLGIEHHYSLGLRRLAVRAGTNNSFVEASKDLQEYCGLEVSYQTIAIRGGGRHFCLGRWSTMDMEYRA